MSKALVKSTTVVSSMTLLSRILGFVRDMVCAYLFGATAAFDAYLVAFKIPNFMRRLFAEGAFSQAFVPVLAEYQQTHSEDKVKAFVNHMAGTLGTVLLLFCLLGIIFAPLIVIIFAPGFIHDPYRFSLATHMLRVTFPYLFLISLVAFSGAVLNTYSRFAAPAFTPVLLNVAIITAAVWFTSYFTEPVIALAWGVTAGGVLQLLFQLPFLQRIRMLPKPKFAWRDAGVRRVLKLMVPALFGVSVAQISLLIDTIFASFLAAGSISWLYYSVRLTYFPLGVFGVALATVVLPHLSRKHANKATGEFSASLDWALRSLLVVGIPAGIGLLLLAGPLLTTLFQYDKFNAFDVLMSRESLWAYSIGLPAFMLVKVLAAGFYSRQNIKTPVKIAAIALGTNIVLNFALVFSLKHAGLALATSLASSLNALLLFVYLLREKVYQPQPGWGVYGLRLLLANGLMAVVLWFASPRLQQWLDWRWYDRLWHLLALIAAAIVVYFISLWLSGLRLRHFKPVS